MIDQTQNLAHLSFLDDTSPQSPFEFVLPTVEHQNDLGYPAVLHETLTYRDVSKNLSQKGFYALQGNLLASYLTRHYDFPDSVLDLAFARMKLTSSSPLKTNDGILFTKNGRSHELVFKDSRTAEIWYKALKSVCVMTDFHEHYKANKVIGKGSFAVVYLGVSKNDGQQYAIKAFSKDILMNQTQRMNPKEGIRNEVTILRALFHDNIIKLYEVYETDRSLYLIMELIQGCSLQELLNNSSLKKKHSENQIVKMIYSILDASAYIASKGIMHRDLKPSNILLDKHAKIKIVDFGLATYIKAPQYIFKKCGTPGYIAPEIFKYDSKKESTFYDDHCDAFSIGCTIFNMLFGQPLFKGNGPTEILAENKEYLDFQRATLGRKDIEKIKNKINRDALDLITHLLEHDPKKRLSSSLALLHDYFSSIPQLVKKSMLSQVSLQYSDSLEDCSSPLLDKGNKPFEEENIENVSPLLRQRRKSLRRFSRKGSLYLNLGRPEMNGKIDSLAIGDEVANSIHIKGDNSQSSLGSSEQKIGSKSKKGAVKNQTFLKAAIFNNMQKHNESIDFGNEEMSKLPTASRSHKGFVPRAKSLSIRNAKEDTSEESEDFHDDEEEELKIPEEFENHEQLVKSPTRHTRIQKFPLQKLIK